MFNSLRFFAYSGALVALSAFAGANKSQSDSMLGSGEALLVNTGSFFVDAAVAQRALTNIHKTSALVSAEKNLKKAAEATEIQQKLLSNAQLTLSEGKKVVLIEAAEWNLQQIQKEASIRPNTLWEKIFFRKADKTFSDKLKATEQVLLEAKGAHAIPNADHQKLVAEAQKAFDESHSLLNKVQADHLLAKESSSWNKILDFKGDKLNSSIRVLRFAAAGVALLDIGNRVYLLAKSDPNSVQEIPVGTQAYIAAKKLLGFNRKSKTTPTSTTSTPTVVAKSVAPIVRREPAVIATPKRAVTPIAPDSPDSSSSVAQIEKPQETLLFKAVPADPVAPPPAAAPASEELRAKALPLESLEPATHGAEGASADPTANGG